jgi:transposase InsO family protein
MIHSYIKIFTPRLNGKVERSHLTDKLEFYQFLEYTDDIDLSLKLKEWENFYNFWCLHGVLNGESPYERLKKKLPVPMTV